MASRVAFLLLVLVAACDDDAAAIGEKPGDAGGGKSGAGPDVSLMGLDGGMARNEAGVVPPMEPLDDDPEFIPPTCEHPWYEEEDICLACLEVRCCDELHSSSHMSEDDAGVTRNIYSTYKYIFSCVVQCFDAALIAEPTADPADAFDGCRAKCKKAAADDDIHTKETDSLAACAVDGREGSDGGTDGCLAECFPAWQE